MGLLFISSEIWAKPLTKIWIGIPENDEAMTLELLLG